MKLSLLGPALLLSAGLVAAIPAAEAEPALAAAEPRGRGRARDAELRKRGKSPPKAPKGKFSSASNQCRASQSSISCCNVSQGTGGSKSGKSKSKTVFASDGPYAMDCSQIINGDGSQLSSAICSQTIACCIGDGCIAIADGNNDSSGSSGSNGVATVTVTVSACTSTVTVSSSCPSPPPPVTVSSSCPSPFPY